MCEQEGEGVAGGDEKCRFGGWKRKDEGIQRVGSGLFIEGRTGREKLRVVLTPMSRAPALNLPCRLI